MGRTAESLRQEYLDGEAEKLLSGAVRDGKLETGLLRQAHPALRLEALKLYLEDRGCRGPGKAAFGKRAVCGSAGRGVRCRAVLRRSAPRICFASARTRGKRVLDPCFCGGKQCCQTGKY